MQYPYLTLLEIITIFLTLLIGAVIFYLLVKRGRMVKFATVLKSLGLYFLGALIFYLIYPFAFLSRIFNIGLLGILDILIFGAVLFFIFYFIMRRFFLMGWKKSLVFFLLLIIIILPFLNFFRMVILGEIINLGVFAEESEAAFEEWMRHGIQPTSFKISQTIGRATLYWLSDYFREIAITI